MKEVTPAPVPVQGPVDAATAGGLKTSPPHSHLAAGLATQTQQITKAVEEATTTSATTTSKWNTKNLGLRLGADLVSAASAAVLVAPVISIIDRSIMENASGAAPLLVSLRRSILSLFLSPRSTILSKPFGLIFLLYGGTYLTANTLDTTVSTVRNQPPTHVTSGSSKFFASSAANIGLCIYKDQVFVRLFGPPGVTPRPVGLPSYLLFAVRDCMTIFASFNVPPLLGPVLTEKLKDTKMQKLVTGQTMAQFAAPAVVQLLSTPVHLLGLDMYNRPSGGAKGPSWGERWTLVRKNWAVSVAARICRIVPAFGVGGVVNMKVRKGLMERLS